MRQYSLYIKIILIGLIIIVGAIIIREPAADVVVRSFPLLDRKIYLDAGHGGYDPGARKGGIDEKDLALQIVLRLKDELEHNGAIVYLIRDEDEDFKDDNASSKKRSDLNQRIRMINNSDCDIYITLHLNASPSSSWRGSQTFYYPSFDNEKLAYLVQESLKSELKNTTRHHKLKKDSYLLENTTKPGILIEAGFMSNPQELLLLSSSDYQGKLVRAITNGIIDYFLPVK